jgi:hypothetical protein
LAQQDLQQMAFRRHLRWALTLLAITAATSSAPAAIVATDDASQAAYSDGWQVGDNGGSGYLAWSSIGRENGSGFGGGFISTNNGAVNIGSGGNNAAFGVFGNSTGVGSAVRPLTSALPIGYTLSIDMDNQSIDTGGTVGFSLRNAAGNNLAEYYFVGGQSDYTVNAADQNGPTQIDTTLGFTSGGMRLSFRLTSANSFSLSIDQFANGVGVDKTIAANLISNADQAISNIRLFNANGGPDVFFNNIVLSVVPEAPGLALGGGIIAILGIFSCIRVVYRRLWNRLISAQTCAVDV